MIDHYHRHYDFHPWTVVKIDLILSQCSFISIALTRSSKMSLLYLLNCFKKAQIEVGLHTWTEENWNAWRCKVHNSNCDLKALREIPVELLFVYWVKTCLVLHKQSRWTLFCSVSYPPPQRHNVLHPQCVPIPPCCLVQSESETEQWCKHLSDLLH